MNVNPISSNPGAENSHVLPHDTVTKSARTLDFVYTPSVLYSSGPTSSVLPSISPSDNPSNNPSFTVTPSAFPTLSVSPTITTVPSADPSVMPSVGPSIKISAMPNTVPSALPSSETKSYANSGLDANTLPPVDVTAGSSSTATGFIFVFLLLGVFGVLFVARALQKRKARKNEVAMEVEMTTSSGEVMIHATELT